MKNNRSQVSSLVNLIVPRTDGKSARRSKDIHDAELLGQPCPIGGVVKTHVPLEGAFNPAEVLANLMKHLD